ncbi:MAG: transaldolase family protein [Pseudomonadota bacterium]|nr:transaldolase [Gammaproteobacteria bacterium]MEE2683646.1 transaldolase family protein [Pseudomonadota bacterium]|tara:strand:+ start:447 stop:1484 length:1038 start_codon:yes stop_codon:yes gene_type:complete
MDLYLDSVDFEEIEKALDFGFIKGLTTTPTFMHRHGITDIDGAIVKLSGMVPELQVEALGESVDEILKEADRILSLPLKNEPVFKVPISNAGVTACQRLTEKGHRVNVHLIYTLNQAYMAMAAGAAFVCPLAGRMQDQGHDAIQLYEQCVDIIDHYGFSSKVMFSSVRYPEHVRQALLSGVHVCTVPYKVMKNLCDNSLSSIGTEQFKEHTQLITVKVSDLIRTNNPTCSEGDSLKAAMNKMTESRLGAVTVVDNKNNILGIFTDGDIRRYLQSNDQSALEDSLSKIGFSKSPVIINSKANLEEAVKLFSKSEVDSIIVENNNKPEGILDIQDLIKLGLLGQERL